MLEHIATGLMLFADVHIWLWIMLGVAAALILGLIPGLGSLMGMALFLPFAFHLDILEALPCMVALSAVGFTGGSVTAVLMGIPGETANIVTAFDGFPMTKKGEGARAVGAALTASLAGGIISTVFAVGMMFAITPVAMAITSREMVVIILIGLAFICVLGKGDRVKSLISGCIGMLLSCAGMVSMTAEPRFTFDFAVLLDGLPLVPVTLGMFALPPIVELAMQGGDCTITDVSVEKISLKNTLQGVKDVFRNKMLCLRCSTMGYFFGILPGVGAQAAVFLAYGHAKGASPDPDSFGKGNVQGVIAPESCNNAKESGSWLTTFALGIPGSGTGALGLACLIMLGINPGPAMITDHFDLTFALLMTVVIANALAFMICLPLASRLALITLVPGRLLVPIVTVFITVGAFAFRSQIPDVIILIVFCVIGLLCKRYGYNAPSMLLGFILGKMFEDYLFISLQVDGPTFFLRPIPLGLLGCFALFMLYSLLRSRIERKKSC